MNAADNSPEHLTAILRLALTPGVGPKTYQSLIEYFGSAEAAAAAAPSELRKVAGIGPKLMRAIIDTRTNLDLESELQFWREQQVQVLTVDHANYPRLLREIHSPPTAIFLRDQLAASDALAIAIVGTRHATSYGARQAERLAIELSHAGFTIVSGMARGIDAAAHRGALQAGGRTIAVLGCGVLNVYPPEHADLANQIRQRGTLISEAPPASQPQSGLFPQRNRLISGLSLGVIVVEAAERSGALISAEHAMEQGREVFAVPGPVDSRTSRGCHQLLREGAKLVESADDVLEELGPLVAATPRDDGRIVRHPAELLLNEQEQTVLDATANEPRAVDQVVALSGLPVQRVLATLSVLEMRRLVRRLAGSLVARV